MYNVVQIFQRKCQVTFEHYEKYEEKKFVNEMGDMDYFYKCSLKLCMQWVPWYIKM